MAKHATIAALFVAIAAAIVANGLRHTGATSADKAYHLLAMIAGTSVLAIVVVVAAAAHKKQRAALRNLLLLVAFCILVSVSGPFVAQQNRISRTADRLSSVYSELTATGPPFPARDVLTRNIDPDSELVSHGYWVSADREAFELYYHVASDSCALVYPHGRWEWRGYNYSGPDG